MQTSGFVKYDTVGLLPKDFSLSEEVLALLSEEKQDCVFPGFCDVHVHFREPGFSYKETIRTGSLAAAHGDGIARGEVRRILRRRARRAVCRAHAGGDADGRSYTEGNRVNVSFGNSSDSSYFTPDKR